MNSTTKKIMIFGAGINQLELIRAAKELKVVSVVIDPNSNVPGAKEADYFYCIPGNEYETTKKILSYPSTLLIYYNSYVITIITYEL